MARGGLRGGLMYEFPLTAAQKTFLRGAGQTLEASVKVGKSGLTPEFFTELQKQLNARELIKVRFVAAERDERAALAEQIADAGRCVFVSSVGATALFFRQNPDPSRRVVTLA
jgi:RNA-binding protein